MSNSADTEDERKNDRRVSQEDRRVSCERRNEERLNHMKSECRSHTPRRESDEAGKKVEGD